jgi:hypothetical protein
MKSQDDISVDNKNNQSLETQVAKMKMGELDGELEKEKKG